MIGYTFSPADQNNRLRQLNGANGQLGPNASEALRVLSLRLPTVLGGGSPLSSPGLLAPSVAGHTAPPASAVSASNAASLGPVSHGPVAGPIGSTPAPGGGEVTQLINLINNTLRPVNPTIRPGEGPGVSSNTLPAPASPSPSPIGGPTPNVTDLLSNLLTRRTV